MFDVGVVSSNSYVCFMFLMDEMRLSVGPGILLDALRSALENSWIVKRGIGIASIRFRVYSRSPEIINRI